MFKCSSVTLLSFALLVPFASMSAEEESGPKKLTLRISAIETPGTRSSKTLQLPDIPSFTVTPAHSEEEIATAAPEMAAKMMQENLAKKRAHQEIRNNIAMERYKKQCQYLEGLRKQLESTALGQQIILGLDKFSGYAYEYFNKDCIEFFHRMDTDEVFRESMISGKDADLATSNYFIKLVFDNPHQEKAEGNIQGTTIHRTTWSQSLSFEVQDMTGKVMSAGNITKTKTKTFGDANVMQGQDKGAMIELIEECMKEAAQKINDSFVLKVKFTVVSAAKKDKDFDAEDATIKVDGEDVEAGEEVCMLKGKHTVEVDMEGYAQKGGTSLLITKSGTRKIKMVKDKGQKKGKDDEDGEED